MLFIRAGKDPEARWAQNVIHAHSSGDAGGGGLIMVARSHLTLVLSGGAGLWDQIPGSGPTSAPWGQHDPQWDIQPLRASAPELQIENCSLGGSELICIKVFSRVFST